jgi:hypothetical protein
LCLGSAAGVDDGSSVASQRPNVQDKHWTCPDMNKKQIISTDQNGNNREIKPDRKSKSGCIPHHNFDAEPDISTNQQSVHHSTPFQLSDDDSETK